MISISFSFFFLLGAFAGVVGCRFIAFPSRNIFAIDAYVS
jgi:hypothetical protein